MYHGPRAARSACWCDRRGPCRCTPSARTGRLAHSRDRGRVRDAALCVNSRHRGRLLRPIEECPWRTGPVEQVARHQSQRADDAKYGSAGVAGIEMAVKALATADAARGFDTRLVYLDGRARRGAGDRRRPTRPRTRRPSTRWPRSTVPSTLVILGVPRRGALPGSEEQAARSRPIRTPTPIASPAATCRMPARRRTARTSTKFLGPTRVVGRIPDMTGADTPSYLIGAAQGERRGQAGAAARLVLRAHRQGVGEVHEDERAQHPGRGAGGAHLADRRPQLHSGAAAASGCTS